jgi:hypothetical protein
MPKIERCIELAPFIEQQRGLEDPEAAAAVLLRHRDPQPVGFGEGLVELPGELVALVLSGPVLVVEAGGQLGHCRLDRALLIAQLEVQLSLSHRGKRLFTRLASSRFPVSVRASTGNGNYR